MEPQKGFYNIKNKRANLFSLPTCCHHHPINLAQIFTSQCDTEKILFFEIPPYWGCFILEKWFQTKQGMVWLFCHAAKAMKNSGKQKVKLALRIKYNYCTFADLIVVITIGFKTLLIN